MSPPRSNSGSACAIGLAYNIRFCAMAPGDSCGFLSDETGEKAVVLIPRRGGGLHCLMASRTPAV